jgi:hypothetical protein
MRVERMRVLTANGVRSIDVLGDSDTSSLIGRHWNAVKHFLNTGETEVLEPFRGWRVGPHRLAIAPDFIEQWALAGELDFEDIYDD